MKKLSLEMVNNMSEDAMRQLLRDEVVEQHLKEQAEAERIKAEEEVKVKDEKAMNDFFANKICHFSSCQTLANDEVALKFKQQTGAKLVTGYKSSVDAMRSAIADLAYFNELMHIKNVGVILNENSKFRKTYKSLLEELKFQAV